MNNGLADGAGIRFQSLGYQEWEIDQNSGPLRFFQPGVTYMTLSNVAGLSVTGNVTGGNLVTAGLITATGNIDGGNLRTAGLISATGNITGANVIINGTAAAGSAVLIVSGNIQTSAANATANIGNATNYFNVVHAKATSAQYADLAELYLADQHYEPGTVVEFGGAAEVHQTYSSHSTRIAGVVSTNPSYIMNAGLGGSFPTPVALTGRVPCQVLGPVTIGDVLVSSNIPGVAQRIIDRCWKPGCVIGKAMQNIDQSGVQTIEIAVGRF